MGEPTWTTMHIGGALTPDKIEELYAIADGEFSDRQFIADFLEQAQAGVEPLMLQGFVNMGDPDEVIDFCKENGLTFWLHFDAGSGWDSGIQVWHHGWDGVKQCSASGQGYEAVIAIEALKARVERGEAVADIIAEFNIFNESTIPAFTLAKEEAKETA